MINIDLSKVRLPDWATYFLGVVPGLIFEAAVLIRAPETAQKIVGDTDRMFRLPPYALLIGLVASAFVIGQIFLQLAWLASSAMDAIYWLLDTEVRRRLKCPAFQERLRRYEQHRIERRFSAWLHPWEFLAAKSRMKDSKAKAVRGCLCIATRKLLKTRYGISLAERPAVEEWSAWFRALGKPPRDFLQGQRLMRISLASGLAGFLALLFRPSLSKWYLYAACTVFSFTGLLIMWRQAEWKADPDKQNLLMLQSALSDLAEARGAIPAEADKEA